MLGRLKVSVAMCTYNGARVVRAQLESILNQTRLPDEIIVIDDCSTDATLDVVRKTAEKNERIHFSQNEKNLGYLKNFESAIQRTTGHIIFLSDQDDVWFNDKIETMMAPFERDPETVLVYSDASLTDSELQPTGATMFGRRKDLQVRKVPNARELGRGVGFNGPAVAFHARLKPFVLPFSPLSHQWGHDHWIGFIAYAIGGAAVIDRPLLYYRRHAKNRGGDVELDGGLLHQWRVVEKKFIGTKQYQGKRRMWEDMVARLREIKQNQPTGVLPEKLDELLEEAEACLQFARVRESLKLKQRWARLPMALRLFLFGEDYQRRARGIKSLVQDVLIP
jgi:glycosyltransferase involved in cell wall biosynthesis